jgi:4-hydroxybenzoate polyprenyltransferase
LGAILLLNIPFVAASFFMNGVALTSMWAFLLLSVFYSTPPIRARAIPVVDSMFNALYIMPGIFAFGIMSGELPPIMSIIAAILWTMAMHAYSAIPDIQADKEAGVETIATLLRREGTLFFCSACYLLAAIFAFPYLGPFAGILGLIYLSLMGLSLFTRQTGGVYRIYRYFPLVNSACGFLLFWYAAIENFSRRS